MSRNGWRTWARGVRPVGISTTSGETSPTTICALAAASASLRAGATGHRPRGRHEDARRLPGCRGARPGTDGCGPLKQALEARPNLVVTTDMTDTCHFDIAKGFYADFHADASCWGIDFCALFTWVVPDFRGWTAKSRRLLEAAGTPKPGLDQILSFIRDVDLRTPRTIAAIERIAMDAAKPTRIRDGAVRITADARDAEALLRVAPTLPLELGRKADDFLVEARPSTTGFRLPSSHSGQATRS